MNYAKHIAALKRANRGSRAHYRAAVIKTFATMKRERKAELGKEKETRVRAPGKAAEWPSH